MLPSTPVSSSRWPLLVLLGVLAFGMVGLVQVTMEDITLPQAAQATSDLSVDEKAYYDFVEPRLARLSDEVSAVAEMVDGKSRNIVDLTVRGHRIETLTIEILEQGDTSGVPERFSSAHENIRQASQVINASFDEARAALRKFNFSNMTTLAAQFHRATDVLTLAHEELVALVTSPVGTVHRLRIATA